LVSCFQPTEYYRISIGVIYKMVKGVLLASLVTMIVCSGFTLAADKKTRAKDDNHTQAENSRLRCWQQGKLLFNEVDWHSFTVANKENVINFTKDDKDNQTLSLINMGETICLYQKKDSVFK